MTKIQWDKHYTRSKSVLFYPDENLVRMLKKYIEDKGAESLAAVDLGCGSGRHLKMLSDIGIKFIIGTDYSYNGLEICRELYPFPLVQCDNSMLPFDESSFDVAVSWGSLHYCRKNAFGSQFSEIHRILKKNGRFFGTLRSDYDTYLKKGENIGNGTWITDLDDIKDSVVSFSSENELKISLGMFTRLKYGIAERTLIGDMNKKISHWIFWAEK